MVRWVYSMGMTNTTQTEAPDFIARDTYAGRHTVLRHPGTVRSAVFTAAELAAMAPSGILWEAFGRVQGCEGFGRTRYVADAEGNLHCYDSDGAKKIVHPAGRRIRVLTK